MLYSLACYTACYTYTAQSSYGDLEPAKSRRLSISIIIIIVIIIIIIISISICICICTCIRGGWAAALPTQEATGILLLAF